MANPFRAFSPSLRVSPLHQAVRLALLGATLAAPLVGGLLLAPPVQAQERAAEFDFAIAAGSLEAALMEFSATAGVTLSFAPQAVHGRQSAGLQGRYASDAALQALLAGSGLQAQRQANGSYSLQPVRDDSALNLGVTTVTARGLDATTEGSGSYTSGSSNTALKLPLSLRETPQAVSVITRQRMDDQNLTQLLDVARQTPGLSVNQAGNAGSDSSEIYSRGFAVENYQIDGEQLLDSNYNSIFQTSDMVIYDRVEVLRGATGLMNGIGTPGATINLVRKRPTARWQSSVTLKGGSWDYQRGELDVGGPLNAEGTLRARIVGAYQENDSYVERLHERKQVLYGIVEADLSPDTLLTLGMDAQYHDADNHSRGGLPLFNQDGSRTDWSRSDSAAAAWASSERHFVSAFATLEHQFNDAWKVRANLSQGRFEYDEVLGYAAGGNPNPATGTGVNLWAGRWEAKPVQTGIDLSSIGSFALFGQEHDAVLGYSRHSTDYKAPGYNLWWHDDWDWSIEDIYNWDGKQPARPDMPAVSRIDTSEQQSGAYANTRIRASDDLSIILGGRVSNWESTKKTDNFDPSQADSVDKRSESGVFTPYAGVVYDLDQHWSLYASYTSIFKPQSRMTNTGGYLDPLEGVGYEIGSKAEFFDGRLNLGLALYQIEQDNLAVAVPGEFAPDGSQAYRAESGTETRGVEVEVSGELATDWQASVSFSRNLVQDADGHKLNTNIPQNTFKLFTSYTLRGIGNGLTLGGGVNWQSEIYSDGVGPGRNQRFTQDDYALVDLMARYPLSRQLSATLNLNNLLDEKYYTSTSSSYYGAPRNASLGLRLEF